MIRVRRIRRPVSVAIFTFLALGIFMFAGCSRAGEQTVQANQASHDGTASEPAAQDSDSARYRHLGAPMVTRSHHIRRRRNSDGRRLLFL